MKSVFISIFLEKFDASFSLFLERNALFREKIEKTFPRTHDMFFAEKKVFVSAKRKTRKTFPRTR